MTTMRLIGINDVDDATLSASPAVTTGCPVTNLQQVSRSLVVRTTGTSAQDIKGTWSAAKVLSGCALMRHNLTSDATWRLRLYSDAAWTTLVYDSGAVTANPSFGWGEFGWGLVPWGASVFTNWDQAFSVMWFTAVSAMSFTLTLTDASNPDGYLQASRLFLGAYFAPTINVDWGLAQQWDEHTKQIRTEDGTLRSDGSDPFRRFELTLRHLTAGERAQLFEIVRRVGLREDMFLSLRPDEAGALERDYAGAVKLTQMPKFSHDFYANYTTSLTLEES